MFHELLGYLAKEAYQLIQELNQLMEKLEAPAKIPLVLYQSNNREKRVRCHPTYIISVINRTGPADVWN